MAIEPPPPPNKSPRWAIVLATLLPLAACPASPVLLLRGHTFSPDSNQTELIWLTLLLGVGVGAVSGRLLAGGRRLPIAVPLFFAALPWVVADATVWRSIDRILSGLSDGDPEHKAWLMASGLGDAMGARSFGALSSSVLLGCIGLSFAAAAVGLGKARSAALVAGCSVAFGFALAGAATVAVFGPPTDALYSALHANGKIEALAVGPAVVGDLRPNVMLAVCGWSLALIVVLAVGGWAVRRGGSLGELAAAIVLLGLVAAADFTSSRATNDAVNRAVVRPWAAVPGFEPVMFSGSVARSQLVAFVTADQWTEVDGEGGFEKPFESPQELARALKPRTRRSPSGLSAEIRAKMEKKWDRDAPPMKVALALDARLTSQQLRALFDTAAEENVAQLELVGESSRAALTASPDYDPLGWTTRLLDWPRGVELRITRDKRKADFTVQRIEVGADGPLSEIEGEPEVAVLVPTDAMTVRGLLIAAHQARVKNAIASWPDVDAAALPNLHGGEPQDFAPNIAPDLVSRVPVLTEQSTVVEGTLDAEVVKRFLHARTASIKACYVRRLHEAPALAGTVNVKFEVTATGRFTDIEVVSSTLKDSEVERCVVSNLRRMVLARPENADFAVVTYQLAFETAAP